MKFFVPYAADDAHAEQIWSDSRSDLFDLGLPTTRRRIWALSLDVTKPNCLLHIGREVPDDYGPAMLIFEASDLDVYYVCTPWNGVLGGEPFAMALARRGRARSISTRSSKATLEQRCRREAPASCERRWPRPAGEAGGLEPLELIRRHGAALPRPLHLDLDRE